MLIWEGFALGLICPRICGHFLAHYYIWLCFCDGLSQVENKSNEWLQTVVTADWCPNGLTGHRPVAIHRLSTIFSADALSNASVHYKAVHLCISRNPGKKFCIVYNVTAEDNLRKCFLIQVGPVPCFTYASIRITSPNLFQLWPQGRALNRRNFGCRKHACMEGWI